MKNVRFFLILPLFIFLFSCGGTYHARYSSPLQAPSANPILTESLFDYKERTLSEWDIQYILDSDIALRDTVRLAVFNFGGSLARYGAWSWKDEESLQNQQQLLDTLTYALTQARRVQKVILLPAMVTGNKPNIHQLREAAVRVQADMLLVFNLYGDLFQKYKLFKKDEAKAFATSESVLMDVRTGIIPHTSVVTTSAQSVKEKQDFVQEELEKRALHQANLQALLETGNKVAAFLNR